VYVVFETAMGFKVCIRTCFVSGLDLSGAENGRDYGGL
jgi:hypothetical protein